MWTYCHNLTWSQAFLGQPSPSETVGDMSTKALQEWVYLNCPVSDVFFAMKIMQTVSCQWVWLVFHSRFGVSLAHGQNFKLAVHGR